MSDRVSAQPLPGSESDSPAAGSRRTLMIVGGLAVLLVFGAGVYFLFLSGGGEEDLGSVPSGAAPIASASPDVSKTKAPDDSGKNFHVGRDPFEPLPVEAESAAPADTSDSSDTSDDTSGSSSDPSGSNGGTNGGGTVTTAPTTTPSSPAPTTSPTQDPNPPVSQYKVTLKSVDVAKDKATIEVNGKRYIVKVKELFTNSNTGPFKLTWVGQRPDGKDTAKVVFGSDAPVELVQKDTVVFQP
ncbi:MAG: hypothetical protein ACJ73J_04905 [Actinomycetes bacterium]